MKKIFKPELLSPAGDWPSLKAALEGGADSVYFGVKGMNMRHLATNFDILEIRKVMDLLKQNNKKGYLTLNTVVKNQELKKVAAILKEAKKAKVDAVILWDMAVFALAKDLGLSVHISTQASISNFKALEFFTRMGAKRVVLARECTLAELKEIIRLKKQKQIDCQIETFIHGAMCVSISGRCFLSSYSYGKSANRGQCLQPCRREYLIKDTEGQTEYLLGKDYILSPKDLCAIDFLDELIEAKIDTFKIEGRIRSAEYTRVVTSVYRAAIDSYGEGTFDAALKKRLKERLASVYNRGFSSGFYFGHPAEAKSIGLEHTHEKIFIGSVTKFYKKINVAEIKIQNGVIRRGDPILFVGKHTPALLTPIEEMQLKGSFVSEAKKGESIGVKLPFVVKIKDKVFIWRKKV